MAISLSYFSLISLFLGLAVHLSEAATVTYNWNITWVLANPDGAYVRPTIGINGEWPLPILEANKGDRVIVNVDNQLGNQTTTLHFHGLYMNGSTEMDGPLMVSQCGIAPGSQFTYNFTVSITLPAPNSTHRTLVDFPRLTNLVHTGTIPTPRASIPTVFEHLSLSTTQTIHTQTKSMENLVFQSQIGTIDRCKT